MYPLPAYLHVTFEGYPLRDSVDPPGPIGQRAEISIFSVEGYSDVDPNVIAGVLPELKNLMDGGAAVCYPAAEWQPVIDGSEELPILPGEDAGQELCTRYATVHVPWGTGIRFLFAEGQGTNTVSNRELGYAYQGLTTDGRYWVSAVFGVTHPSLPAAPDDSILGSTQQEVDANWAAYITGISANLDSAPASSFTPSIDNLDFLISSIRSNE